MTMIRYNIQTGANGSVMIPATPFADGAEIEVVLRMPMPRESVVSKTADMTPEEREAAFDDFRKFAGCLKDMPGKELVSKKQIRSSRLEEKYGEQSEEQRKAAGRKFFEKWDGLLEGAPDMTAKEIRAERLERKYGQ